MNAQRSSFIATLLAVLWSFAGIRRGADYQADARQLRPVHLIVAGVIGGLLFVLTLVFLVHLVVAQG